MAVLKLTLADDFAMPQMKMIQKDISQQKISINGSKIWDMVK